MLQLILENLNFKAENKNLKIFYLNFTKILLNKQIFYFPQYLLSYFQKFFPKSKAYFKAFF